MAEEDLDRRERATQEMIRQRERSGDIRAQGIAGIGEAQAGAVRDITSGYLRGQEMGRERGAHEIRKRLAEENLNEIEMEQGILSSPAMTEEEFEKAVSSVPTYVTLREQLLRKKTRSGTTPEGYPWGYTNRVDDDGRPIVYSRKTGEFKVGDVKSSIMPYQSEVLKRGDIKFDREMELAKERIAADRASKLIDRQDKKDALAAAAQEKAAAAAAAAQEKAATAKDKADKEAAAMQEKAAKEAAAAAEEKQKFAVPGYEMTGEVQPTIQEATKSREITGTLSNFNKLIDDYQVMIEKHGPEEFTGTSSGVMASMATSIDMELKTLYELGALTGPDYAILKTQITDPQSIRAIFTRTGTAKAALGSLKNSLNSKVEASLRSRGYKSKAPYKGGSTGSKAQRKDPAAMTPEERADELKRLEKYRNK